MAAPMIPALNDHELEAILEACAEAGAGEASYTLLRLPEEVKPLFEEWLAAHAPQRATHVMNQLRAARGGRENDVAPRLPHAGTGSSRRMQGSGEYAELLRGRFRLACRRLALNRRTYDLDGSCFRPPLLPGTQLGLL
jgi:DNA repair photolyase